MSGHFSHNPLEHGFDVPEEWLPLTQEIGVWARNKAAMWGITCGIYPGCREAVGAPAIWDHGKKELIVDPDVAIPGQDPKEVDFKDALWQNENPKLYGLIMHEIGHGVGTRYSGAEYIRAGARARHIDVIMTVEEPNAEMHAIERFGRNAVRFMRHTALELVLDEWKIPPGRYGAAVTAGLLLARVDAGVLTDADVQPYRDLVVAELGEETLRSLQQLWQKYLRNDPEMTITERLEWSEEWLALIGEDEKDPTVANKHLPSGQQSEDEEGEGGGGLAEAVEQATRRQANDSDLRFVKSRRTLRENRDAREAADRAEISSDGEDAEEGAGDPDMGGAGEGSPGRRSYRIGTRAPSTEERRGMVVLAERLEQADFRARTRSRGTSDSPPGRLRSAAMQLDAARSMGIPPQQTDIFSVRKLKADYHPPLTVGLMTDVSGSMYDAAAALCTTQWMLSNAVERIQGRIASMFFGVGHYRGLRVGERHDDVDVWEAKEGYEMPFPAFQALDHQLDLLHGDGARLLVIATDARWSQKLQRKEMGKVMQLSRSTGLHVIWATFTGWTVYAKEYNTGAVLDLQGIGPVASAAKIGDAAVDLVQRSNQ